MQIKERTRKGTGQQIVFKLISQPVKLLDRMMVTDMRSCVFPDMLLRIEIRRSWWKEENCQGWVVGQALAKG
jgi:hypothetical protein